MQTYSQRKVLKAITRYKDFPNSKDSEIIITHYKPYILSWVFTLRVSNDPSNTAQNKFYQLFSGSDVYYRSGLIRNSLKPYEQEEIENEVCIAFLESCRRCENPFQFFIYYLANRVRILIKDPLVYGSLCLNNIEDSEYSLETKIDPVSGEIISNVIESENPIIAGLTEKEIELINRWYLKDETRSQIATELKYPTENSVSKAILRVTEKCRQNQELWEKAQ